MPELPAHQDTGPAESEAPIVGTSPRLKLFVAVAVVALLALVATLHLTGVLGGSSH